MSALAILWLLLNGVHPGIAPPSPGAMLSFVDDRGTSIEAGLTVCFQIDLRNDCTTVTGDSVALPEAFQSVRVEGAEHGPVSIPKGELERDKRGRTTLPVPRKGRLAVASGSWPLTLSFYPRQDDAFRKPFFRTTLKNGEFVLVPAGDFVASLSEPGHAPDLHLLSIPPATRVKARYVRRDGWTLLLRGYDALDRQPVADASVALRTAEGFGPAGERTVRTTRDGFAILAGLGVSLASATFNHPSYVPQVLYALTATPGTFGFFEAGMEKGGVVRAHITSKEAPALGALCRLLNYAHSRVAGKAGVETLYEGRADRGGICTSSRLAAGTYTLEVRLPEESSAVEQAVIVENGQMAEKHIDLLPIRLFGRVTRGSEPAIGYQIRVHRTGDVMFPSQKAEPTPVVVPQADEQGDYEATLWAPGSYFLTPIAPSGGAAGIPREVWLEGSEERADFDLNPFSVHGVVVDDQGRGIANAQMTLREERMIRLASTAEDGSFEIPLVKAGHAKLTAFKPGYRRMETPFEMEISEETSPPPVVLKLQRASTVQGVIVSASGAPVANAWVTAAAWRPAGEQALSSPMVSDSVGHFEIEPPAGSPLRLFVSGPGCPLTVQQIPPDAANVNVACSDLPGAIRLTFRDAEGRALPHVSVRLRSGSTVVPLPVLGTHLAGLGVPTESNGSGNLALVGLSPGTYDIFFADSSSEESIGQGHPSGYATTVTVAPLSTAEIEITRAES